MAGNTFGKIFRVTTFGESHGKGVGVVFKKGRLHRQLKEDELVSAFIADVLALYEEI